MLSDKLKWWDVVAGGQKDQERGDIHIYLLLIHVDVRQKPTHYCKAVSLQIKINK